MCQQVEPNECRMGVPVVTYPGRTFAGHHSTSHLTNAGFGQFVAVDLAEYVELAIQWAGRIDELAALRQQFQQSLLWDCGEICRGFSGDG